MFIQLIIKQLILKTLCIQQIVNVGKTQVTRMVLVFATERKNNVDPRLRSQKKVNNIQPVFTKLTSVHLMCQIFMNDLLTEQGQQRSRVIR